MTNRYLYVQSEEEFYPHNIINSDELSTLTILPQVEFCNTDHGDDDTIYYLISCYSEENFNQFAMNAISPQMTRGVAHLEQLEEIYNDPDKLNEYFIQNNIIFNIPNIIRKQINAGKVKVLVFHALEGYHSINMNYVKKLLGVEPSSVIFLTGDYRYNTPVTDPSGITLMWINYWERSCAGLGMHTPQNIKSYLDKYKNDLVQNETRKYMNTFYNRRIRDHRINAMSVLHKENLLDTMIWSWGGSVDQYTTVQLNNVNEATNDFIRYQYVNYTGIEYTDSIKEVLSWGNLQNGKESTEDLHINLVNTINIDHLSDTYYQFICETWATNDTTFLSEKSFKPFLLGQPFLTWADVGTVSALKQLGYDTFDDVFSHSYDSTEDTKLRLLELRDEIKRVNLSLGQNFFKRKTSEGTYIARLQQNYNNLITSYQRNGINFSYIEERK